QAEDGIRDFHVTGVQTCALPIWVQKLIDMVKTVGSCRLSFSLRSFIVTHEDRLQQFQIPVAELVPHEAIGSTCGFIEAVSVDTRSEERRVGKECRSRRWRRDAKE